MKKETLNLEELFKHEKCNDILKMLYKSNINFIQEIIETKWSFRFAYAYPNTTTYWTLPKIIEVEIKNIDELEKALTNYIITNQKKSWNL